MKKNYLLFFDMDDTLVDMKCESYGEALSIYLHSKGFFKNLKPLPFLNEVNKIASLCPENIFVISACINTPYCKKEKIEWLKKYLPAACKENVIFTDVGVSKAEYLKERGITIGKETILIDDFSRNITDWEAAGGTAIKFKNSFNTKNPEKYKYIINDFSELLDVLEKIRNDG